jgi:prepilin-type N-terminal cleavage/methylation domain-containing protein
MQTQNITQKQQTDIKNKIPTSKFSRGGFTLVELVVTIAIIAILSTIGFASIG